MSSAAPPLVNAPPPQAPPGFDEDDLIDDYYEEEPDYDAYLEEMAAVAAEEDETAPNTNEQQRPLAATTAEAKETTGQESSSSTILETTVTATSTLFGASNEMNENGNDDAHNNIVGRRSGQDDIYSFERFTSKTPWRRTPLSPNSQAKNEMNKRNNTKGSMVMMKSIISQRKKAPEAKLMELLHHNTNAVALRGSCKSKLMSIRTSSKTILKSPKEGQKTQPITLIDGNRVYIQVSEQEKDEKSSNTKSGSGITSCGSSSSSTVSLGVSMKELRRRSDRIMRRQMSNSSTVIAASSSTSNSSQQQSQLWVDKHAPLSFPHLLSDERTNREVLRALRAWDPYVFGREPPARPTYIAQNMMTKNEDEDKNENKNDKRPDMKNRVLLLSGPPGVGKTTLAHIVARHAGYRPLEVNGSDERSASVLTERVQRAMESSTINFNKNHPDYGKPNCLILDEIDGADAKGAIQSLVDIIKADLPSKTDNKGKKKGGSYLRRPIIFICNHKYAPSLRPLLPFAKHFNVDPPSSTRLVARLKAVLSHENIPSTGSLLHQLVVASGGDIRSCMYTLQFMSAKAKDGMDFTTSLTATLSGGSVSGGLKDTRNDVASTVSTIFRKTKNGGRGRDGGFGMSGDRASVARVIDSTQGLGEASTLMNTLFTNLLQVPYIDPTLDRCAVAHELLSSTDMHHRSMGGNDGFGSMSLAIPPATAAAIHLLCRVEIKPDLNFSTREMYDVQYQQSTNQGLIQRFSEGVSPKCKSLKFQNEIVSREVIPQLAWILSAGSEGSKGALSRASSSMDVMTPLERESLDHHVNVLTSLGLTYIVAADDEQDDNLEKNRQRSGFNCDGSRSSYGNSFARKLRLEPPIDRLAEFQRRRNYSAMARRAIPSALKELIALQVRLQNIRGLPSLVSSPSKKEASSTPLKSKEMNVQATAASPVAIGDANQVSSPLFVKRIVNSTPSNATKKGAETLGLTTPASKRLKSSQKTSPLSSPSPVASAKNFLGLGAKKARQSKSARKAAAVGLDIARSKKQKKAHTGSGLLLNQVIRMRYVKGFTQAVHTPCNLKDL